VAPTLGETLRQRAVVLDGGLATQLEAQGHRLTDRLWSARLLIDDPEAIVAAHRAYFEAGAEVATTASYQATREGLTAAGLTAAEADAVVASSVDLAQRAADQHRHEHGPQTLWVAGSVGPYGAMLAEGQEYSGSYDLSVAQLRAFHRPRMVALRDAGTDVLALETVPQLAEVRALVAEVEDLELDAWLSVSVTGRRLRSGEDVTDAFTVARDAPHIVAVGMNCSSPGDTTQLVALAAGVSGKPVVVYPNSGEHWDARRRAWVGTPGLRTADPDRWLTDGARLVGGCCRTGPTDVTALATVVNRARLEAS
jgi:homocysteine S-methyltransferase